MNTSSNLSENQKKEKELIQGLIIKCWEDENFKRELLTSPEETIAKFTGKPFVMPEGKRLVVVDQSSDPKKNYINIPSTPKFDDLELTEEELELVAGGITPALAASSLPCGSWAAGVIIGIGIALS